MKSRGLVPRIVVIAVMLGLMGGCTSVDTTPIEGSWKHHAIISDYLDITAKTLTVNGRDTATYEVIDHGPDFFVLDCRFSDEKTKLVRIDVVGADEIRYAKASYLRR